jgi:hypothetical protein
MIKLPNYAIKESFFRVIPGATQLKHGVFLLCGKCPLCKDYKRRMYVREYPKKYMIFCHNCGYSRNYTTFLKDNYEYELSNLKTYYLESIASGEAFNNKKHDRLLELDDKFIFDKLDYDLRKYLMFHAFPIIEEQSSEQKEKFRQYCIDYLIKRKIKEEVYTSFYCFTKGPLKKYLGIPFFDEEEEKLVHIQGRRMFTPKDANEEQRNPKYKFLKDSEKGIEIDNKPMYGEWNIDAKKKVMVAEGTLDAPAFSNGLGLCGANISQMLIEKVKKKYPNHVWAVDNFWLDIAGNVLTKKLLEMGEKCFIIPKEMTSKDPNDLLTEMNVDEVPDEFIEENTYEGRLGLFELALIDGFKGYVKEEK